MRYLEHDVGRSLLVHHAVDVDGATRDLVVSTGRLRFDAAAIDAAAGALDDVGIAQPAAQLGDVTVAWYPFDPGLPLLAGLAGRGARLAWVPERRAVLADGERVIKLEADPAQVRAAVRALERLRPVVRVPDVLEVDLAAGTFVQERLAGRALGADDVVPRAAAAGALAARIAGVAADDLPELGAPQLLAGLRHVTALVAHAAPELAARIDAVERLLAERAPTLPLVAAHGDFTIGQLIGRDDGSLALVDTDTLCRAPAGLDLAAYATNLLSGRPGDLERMDAALDAVRRGHGGEPDGLPWLVATSALRRIDRPIRRYKRSWPERVALLLVHVEGLATRLG